jgi:hypothetical protein
VKIFHIVLSNHQSIASNTKENPLSDRTPKQYEGPCPFIYAVVKAMNEL